MVSAIGMAVGGFATGSVLSGDTTRYCKNRRDVIISSIVGVIPMGVGTLHMGSVLAIHSGAAGMDTGSNRHHALERRLADTRPARPRARDLDDQCLQRVLRAGFALLSLTRAKDEKRAMFTLIAGVPRHRAGHSRHHELLHQLPEHPRGLHPARGRRRDMDYLSLTGPTRSAGSPSKVFNWPAYSPG